MGTGRVIWENMSLCSLEAKWSSSDPGFPPPPFSSFGCLGPPKTIGPDRRGYEKLLHQPSGKAPPWPGPAPQLPSPPHPPLALLLAFPSTRLSPDFQTLGPLFLINIRQGGQHILRCLTPPHPSLSPTHPTAGYLLPFLPGPPH